VKELSVVPEVADMRGTAFGCCAIFVLPTTPASEELWDSARDAQPRMRRPEATERAPVNGSLRPKSTSHPENASFGGSECDQIAMPIGK